MNDLALFSDLIGDIYEASYQPELWFPVIQKLVQLTCSKSGALFIQDKSIKEASGFYAYGMSDQMLKDYAVNGHQDPGFRIMQDQPVGKAINMQGPECHQVETPEYHKTMRQRYDIGYVGGANVLIDDALHVGLGLHRSASATAYDDETLQALSDLIPHLQRSLRIHREFIRLKIEKTALTAGFDSLMVGLVLFDHLGVPIYINPTAEDILAEHPAIEKQNNNIVPTNTADASQLRQLILCCTQSGDNCGGEQGGVIGLHHPDKSRPLVVLVKPVAGSELANRIDGEPIYAAMYLSDSDRALPISADNMARIYGLTRCEAKIAVALVNGLSVDDIAKTTSRSINTVRSHLRSLFQKTRTTNQADLVRLLLTGVMY